MSKNSGIEIRLDAQLYPKEAVITTCCQFLKDAHVFLSRVAHSTGDIKISLTPKEGSSVTAEEFKNELVHNALRYNVAQRNKDIREYIIKTALLSSQSTKRTETAAAVKSVQDSQLAKKYVEQAESDWKEDPLGIAIPWEEKSKGKKKPAKKKKC